MSVVSRAWRLAQPSGSASWSKRSRTRRAAFSCCACRHSATIIKAAAQTKKQIMTMVTVSTLATLDAIDREVETMIDAALEWAKASPYPDVLTVLDHIYA